MIPQLPLQFLQHQFADTNFRGVPRINHAMRSRKRELRFRVFTEPITAPATLLANSDHSLPRFRQLL